MVINEVTFIFRFYIIQTEDCHKIPKDIQVITKPFWVHTLESYYESYTIIIMNNPKSGHTTTKDTSELFFCNSYMIIYSPKSVI